MKSIRLYREVILGKCYFKNISNFILESPIQEIWQFLPHMSKSQLRALIVTSYGSFFIGIVMMFPNFRFGFLNIFFTITKSFNKIKLSKI